MATLVHRALTIVFKVSLFLGLFLLSMRLIHTYPLPMPPEHQRILFALSQELGVRDPDDLYISTVAIVNLFAAAVEYRLLMKLWRKAKTKWGPPAAMHGGMANPKIR